MKPKKQEKPAVLRAVSNGFSNATLRGKGVYIKHFSTLEHIEIDCQRQLIYDDLIKKGVPSESDQINFLIKTGNWSEAKETQIKQLKVSIEYDTKGLQGAIINSQKKEIKNQIEKNKAILYSIESDRYELIGSTAEKISNVRANEIFIYNSFFLDDTLKTPMIDPGVFDELSTFTLNEITLCYEETMKIINNESLKIISVDPLFYNSFSLCSNIVDYFGKPISKLTYYQVQLLNYAKMFQPILQEGGIPDELLEDPDELTNWFVSKKNSQKTVEKSNKSTKVLVGATREEAKNAGLTDGFDLKKALQEKGGITNKLDLIKILKPGL